MTSNTERYQYRRPPVVAKQRGSSLPFHGVRRHTQSGAQQLTPATAPQMKSKSIDIVKKSHQKEGTPAHSKSSGHYRQPTQASHLHRQPGSTRPLDGFVPVQGNKQQQRANKVTDSAQEKPQDTTPNESPAAEDVQTRRSTLFRYKGSQIRFALAGIVFVAGIGLMTQGFFLNRTVDTQVKALQAENSSAATTSSSDQLPVSSPPKDKDYIKNYHVGATLPRTISIGAIGLHARVLQVGVDRNNTMMTPSTGYDTAWYNGSSRPGEQGAMIINGHVLGDSGPGVFGRLKELKVGQDILIENGAGRTYTYVVQAIDTLKTEQVDMAKLLVSRDTTKPGLSIITCAGKYMPGKNSFDSRTIVYAVLAK